MKLTYEPTEIARFGVRIGRITTTEDEPVNAASILNLCRADAVEMLTLRVPTSRLDAVPGLEQAGFRLRDILVYYEGETGGNAVPGGVPIREATPADAAEVGAIARLCSADYRSHYHADPRLDRAKIVDGYVEWAERSCTDKRVAQAVLLPIVEGKIAGFATLRLNSGDEGEIVLNAVHPDFAGRGVYGDLVNASKRWFSAQGRARIVVSTQLENARVQRSWTNRGIEPSHSYYTFHRWFYGERRA